MRVFCKVQVLVLGAALFAVPAGAQSLADIAGPKELPPAGFSGRQYVDSTGCVFVRAGIGTRVLWVPRVTRDRKQVCGYAPSISGGKAAEAGVPAAEPVAKPAAKPAAKPVAKPVVAARPKAGPVIIEDDAVALPTVIEDVPAAVRLVETRPIDGAATLCDEPAGPALRYLLSDGRRVTRCGGAGADPVSFINDLSVPGLVVGVAAAGRAESARARALDQAGSYRVVWSKGKLRDGAMAEGMPAGTGALYLQVGAFAEAANAERALARLAGLGLPARTQSQLVAGRPLQVVLAGPFATVGERAAALRALRGAGYRDAFPRG
ncbi:MAG: SPOR domain-containing protein [Rhodobacteraceae bacterium]|nr:SPOR domain-containing protein [Paracoccaceae bacterium]